jgi:hypothetical protein
VSTILGGVFLPSIQKPYIQSNVVLVWELTLPDSRTTAKGNGQCKRISASLTSQILYHDVHKTVLKYSTR